MTLLNPPLPLAERATVKWGKLYGAAPALAVAEAARLTAAPLLLVAPDARTAEQLREEIAFFAA